MGIKQLENIWSDWEIEELLGEGASGKVYKAKRKDIEDTYSAIKIIEIPQNESEIREAEAEGMQEAEVREYFKGFVDDLVEEITLLESLKEAKGIVGISDYKVVEKEGTIGWTIYIRMELLTGINKVISEKTITEEDIINLGLDLSEALEYCEKLKIIHRDIKPENIFISKFGEYKLGDFGIARRLENTSSIMSKKGTYLYMPPEVYRGEEYDKTVDLYSLGLVMYKLGNDNRTPFLPKAPNPITYRDKEKALMMRMQGEKIEKPENMSEELFAIIEKMIAYNPSKRYQNAKQVKEDLEKLKEKIAIKYTGTVNIFAHKNKPKTEEIMVETVNEVDVPIAEAKEDVQEEIVESVVEEVVQPEEIIQEKTVPEKIVVEEMPKQEETEQTSTEQKDNKKKIIIATVAILLLIAIILGMIKLFEKGSTEQSINTVLMPNLINLTEEEAEKQIEGKELEITYQDTYQEGAEKGRIVYQSISADTEIEKGSKIVVFINNLEKDQVEKVIMPRVIDLNIAQAMEQLLAMGLQVEKTEENHDTVAKDIVFEQDIAENTEVIKGSKVVLKVSLGAKEEIEQNKQSTNASNNQNKPVSNTSSQTTTSQSNNNTSNTNTQQSNNTLSNTSATWSDWMVSLPPGINSSNSNIETKTQYSYRTKSDRKESTAQTLSGYERAESETYTKEQKYSSVSKPTSLSYTPVDLTQKTYYIVEHYCATSGNQSYAYSIVGDQILNWRVGSANTVEGPLNAISYTDKGGQQAYSAGVKCNFCGLDIWYKKREYVGYEWKQVTTYYVFYKYSNWSSYSDTVANANSTTEVRTRTMYRYKAK